MRGRCKRVRYELCSAGKSVLEPDDLAIERATVITYPFIAPCQPSLDDGLALKQLALSLPHLLEPALIKRPG